MNTRTLLMTTFLTTGIALSSAATLQAAENITTGTVSTASAPITKDELADPRVAAAGFVEHINFARVALAMKNADLASQHITQARNMAMMIKGATTEQRRITAVESGRIVYQYDTEHKYHYFPVQTGPVQVKKISDGPLWATNDLAVTDADIVYLTLDLTGDRTDIALKAAEVAIADGDLKGAGQELARLTDRIVKVDGRVAVPSDKARDNIALARNFIAGHNYDGARYALKHADEALNEMQGADIYKEHRTDIVALREDVSNLQGYITKKDPTMIEKSDKKLDKWYQEMKDWSKS